MIRMTYLCREEGDPVTTEVAGVKFRDREPVELPKGKEWLGHKHYANGNPWFRVEFIEDAPAPEAGAEQKEEPYV